MDGLMMENYTCGFMPFPGQAAGSKCSIAAGSSLQVQYYHGGSPEGTPDHYIASSHKGPIYAYMARHEQVGGIPSGSVWFKVYQKDVIEYGTGQFSHKWASADYLNANGGKITVDIPSDIAPGNYLLRTELIAYHDNRPRGRQPYVNCVELTVTGGGSATPGGASFPGSYDWTDAALNYDIYNANPATKFPVPGNIPMYVAGSTPSTPPSTPPTTPPTTPPSTPPSTPPTTPPYSPPYTPSPPSTPTPPSTCSVGSSGCACTGGGACDPGLVCNNNKLCSPKPCSVGAESCPCTAGGACDPGLTCNNKVCSKTDGVNIVGDKSGSESMMVKCGAVLIASIVVVLVMF